MIIELGDNGLRDRYHWSTCDIDDESIRIYQSAHGTFNSPEQIAAYLAVRSRCSFLTDDNHDWTARDYGPCKPEHLPLKDLMKSSRYQIVIQHKPGQEWYGYRYWFHFGYRVHGQPY